MARGERKFIVYREYIKYVVRVSGLLRALTARYHLFGPRSSTYPRRWMQPTEQADREKVGEFFELATLRRTQSADRERGRNKAEHHETLSVYLDGCARRVSYEPSGDVNLAVSLIDAAPETLPQSHARNFRKTSGKPRSRQQLCTRSNRRIRDETIGEKIVSRHRSWNLERRRFNPRSLIAVYK